MSSHLLSACSLRGMGDDVFYQQVKNGPQSFTRSWIVYDSSFEEGRERHYLQNFMQPAWWRYNRKCKWSHTFKRDVEMKRKWPILSTPWRMLICCLFFVWCCWFVEVPRLSPCDFLRPRILYSHRRSPPFHVAKERAWTGGEHRWEQSENIVWTQSRHQYTSLTSAMNVDLLIDLIGLGGRGGSMYDQRSCSCRWRWMEGERFFSFLLYNYPARSK